MTESTLIIDSPIGRLLLHRRGRRADQPLDGALRGARREPGRRDPVLTAARRQLDAYFAGRLTEFDLPLAPAGTPFQAGVWDELQRIPYGSTVSYAELAGRVGRPGHFRAVGSANGRNPISIIIPCHRVVGSNGSLTGYGGGIDRKRWLLDHEAAIAATKSAPAAAQKRRSRGGFAGSLTSPVRPIPTTGTRPATRSINPNTSSTDGPSGSGMKQAISDGSSTSQSSAMYDADDAVQHAVELAGRGRQPDPLDELVLGRVEVAGADQRGVLDGDAAAVEQHPKRHAPQVARRRRLRRVQVAVRIEPDDGDPAVSLGQPATGADVGAAAPAQHHRPLGQRPGDQPVLLVQVVDVDHRRRLQAEIHPRRLPHRPAALAPGTGHANDPAAVTARPARRARRAAAFRSGQLTGRPGRRRLAQPVDPDAGQAQLVRDDDVVELALGDVHVAVAGRTGLREEGVPVAMRGLVRAHVLGDDHPLERRAQPGQRLGQQVAVAVREDDQVPAAVDQLLQLRRAPRGTPASRRATRT